MTLETVLAGLYRSEINCSISTFWDMGWDVRLGDEMNGWKAETTILCPPHEDLSQHRTLAHVARGLEEVAVWLDVQARAHFPDSEYAAT